jgi:hypothetical protein
LVASLQLFDLLGELLNLRLPLFLDLFYLVQKSVLLPQHLLYVLAKEG